jgi:hypothetical protein
MSLEESVIQTKAGNERGGAVLIKHRQNQNRLVAACCRKLGRQG